MPTYFIPFMNGIIPVSRHDRWPDPLDSVTLFRPPWNRHPRSSSTNPSETSYIPAYAPVLSPEDAGGEGAKNTFFPITSPRNLTRSKLELIASPPPVIVILISREEPGHSSERVEVGVGYRRDRKPPERIGIRNADRTYPRSPWHFSPRLSPVLPASHGITLPRTHRRDNLLPSIKNIVFCLLTARNDDLPANGLISKPSPSTNATVFEAGRRKSHDTRRDSILHVGPRFRHDCTSPRAVHARPSIALFHQLEGPA